MSFMVLEKQADDGNGRLLRSRCNQCGASSATFAVAHPTMADGVDYRAAATALRVWRGEHRCAPCEECVRPVLLGTGPTHAGSERCRSGSIASGGTVAHCRCDVCAERGARNLHQGLLHHPDQEEER